MEPANESQLTTWRRVCARLCPGLSATLALAGGLVLRLWMLKNFFETSGDSRIYGGMAKNLLLYGRYAITDGSGVLHETLIRLPGYPLFLALCFQLFGMENYKAVAGVQIALELLGCVLLADFVRRIASPGTGAALCTLWLAALCPFTASYAIAPLTEAPTLFVIAMALWTLARFQAQPGWLNALGFTFAVTYGALLRPDGALLGVALAPALLIGLQQKAAVETGVRRDWASPAAEKLDPEGGGGFNPRIKPAESTTALAPEAGFSGNSPASGSLSATSSERTSELLPPMAQALTKSRLVRMALVCALLALLPFGLWTWRNWQVFHVFEPLAPRYANDPGEDTNPGWQRWVKTWCLDFVSTYDVYWNVPGAPLDLSLLPNRAFDSEAQSAETAALAQAYNDNGQDLTPGMDAAFARLALERIAAHPLRYYLWLPMGRLADMWLRPRVENLPIDLDWWVYAHHHVETRFSWAYAGLNALYLLLAGGGLWMRPRFWPWMVAYMALRSALLLTVEAPEARYTLECFPMLFVLAGVGLHGAFRKITKLRSKCS
jgi:hypothetical protein